MSCGASKAKGIDWDQQPVGRRSDVAIAESLGVAIASVREQRVKRGIAPWVEARRTRIDWDDQPLGEVSDVDLAARLGVTRSAVRHARIRRAIPPAGSHGRATATDWDAVDWSRSDEDIAADASVTVRTVRRRRRAGQPLAQHTDWDAQPLGKTPDTEIARRLGVHPTAVWRARTRRGIPRYEPE